MTFEYIKAKTIISQYREDSNWFGYNYNMNIYKGCSHGCIYCDSRSECYHIDNFDKVRAKEDAINIIHYELKKKRRVGVIGTGAMSDPYNPFEKELKLTRKALELINLYGYGVGIATKSNLISRDIEVLAKIKEHSPVICKITITTSDDKLSKIIEPNVCPSSDRFQAIKKLSGAGIFTEVLLMPVLPHITDNEENIKNIVRLAHENGAKFIFAGFGVTLRDKQRDYYYSRLDKSFKGLKEKYIKEFKNSYSCGSSNGKELWKIFKRECERYGLLYRMEDIIKAYKSGYEKEQLSLF